MNILVRKNNQERGPYTEAELSERLKSGVFSGSDLGQVEGDTDWKPLSEILLASILATEKTTETQAATPAGITTYSWLRQPKIIGGAIVLLLLIFGGINWLNKASEKRRENAIAARQAAAMEQAQKQEAAMLQQEQERAAQARQAQLDQVKQIMASTEQYQKQYQEKQKHEQEERQKAEQAKVDAGQRQKQEEVKQADQRRLAAEAKQQAQEAEFLRNAKPIAAATALPAAATGGAPPNITLTSIPLGPFPKQRENVILTDDGSRVLVKAAQGSREQAIVDGVPGPLCRKIRFGNMAFSPDKKRVAYITELDQGKEAVVIDGVQSPVYENVGWLAFAPIGHHLAYKSIQRYPVAAGSPHGHDNAHQVIDEGRAGPVFDNISGMTFSQDGEHLAYLGTKVSDQHTQHISQRVVIDGRQEPQEHRIIKDLQISRDGKHVAYIARDYIPNNTGGGRDQDTGVLDGKSGPPFHEVRNLRLSSDGSRCVYVGKWDQDSTGAYIGDKYKVVDNEKGGPIYDEVLDVQVSANGKRTGYIAYLRAGGRTDYFVVDNGKASAAYDGCSGLKISDDGGLLSFRATSPQGMLLVVNGQEFGPFHFIDSEVAYSPEGKHWGCVVHATDSSESGMLLTDGVTHPVPKEARYTGTITLEFQPDKGWFATSSKGEESSAFEVESATTDSKVPSQVIYSRDRQHVVKVFSGNQGSSSENQQVTLDGKPVGPVYLRVHHVQLSDDGQHVAFIGMSNGSGGTALTHVNFDGEEGPAWFTINGLAITPDGKHVAYSAQEKSQSGGVWRLVVDGFIGPPFENILGEQYWEKGRRMGVQPDGSVTFLAVLKGQLARYIYPTDALNAMPSIGHTESVTAGLRVLQKIDADVARDLVLGPNETLYGAQRRGGEYGGGALFSCKTDGRDFKILHSFYGDKESGPDNSLAGDQENVWGTAGSSVFRYNIKKGEYHVVSSERQHEGLRGILPDGSLLGEEGFSDRHWWMLSQDGSSLETTPRQEGVWHQIAAVGPDGAIYWTASDSLYRQTSFWSEPKLLHKFEDSPEEGKDVAPLVTVDPTGTIYGFAKGRTASIIYHVRPDGSDFRVLVPQSRGLKVSSLVAGDDGMLYGCFTAELKTADSQTAGFFSLPAEGGNPAILPNVKSGTDHALIYHHAAIYYTNRSSVVRVQLPSSSGAARQTPVLTIKTVAPPALVSAEPVTFTTSSGESIPSAKAPHGQAGAAIWQPPAPGSTIATVSKQSPPRGQNRLVPSSGGNPLNANFRNAAPSGQGLSQQEATMFAMTNVSAMSAGDMNALASFYADQVDYQDKGVINNDAVKNEFQQYFARWPQTNWQLAGTVTVQPLDASRCQITFPISFDATNPSTNKHATGVARETMILEQNGSGAWRIVMERQTITSKKSDDRRRRTEREKVYQGRPADDNRPRIPIPPNIPWPPGLPRP